jgi:GTPase
MASNSSFSQTWLPKLSYIPPEKDIGKTEYKLKLLYAKDDMRKLNKVSTQIKYRLYQGGGKAVYILGVSDKGDVDGISREELDASIAFLKRAMEIAGAEISRMRIYEGTPSSGDGERERERERDREKGYIATLRLVFKREDTMQAESDAWVF